MSWPKLVMYSKAQVGLPNTKVVRQKRENVDDRVKLCLVIQTLKIALNGECIFKDLANHTLLYPLWIQFWCV